LRGDLIKSNRIFNKRKVRSELGGEETWKPGDLINGQDNKDSRGEKIGRNTEIGKKKKQKGYGEAKGWWTGIPSDRKIHL